MNEEATRLLNELACAAGDLMREIEREVREYLSGDDVVERLIAKLVSILVWIASIVVELSWSSPAAKVISLSMSDWAASLWGINGNANAA